LFSKPQNKLPFESSIYTPNGSRSLAPSNAAANCPALYTTFCGGDAREWPTESGVFFRRQLATSSAAAGWASLIKIIVNH